jgi:hypothetical protein
MSPERLPGRAFRAVADAIVSRAGRDVTSAAPALFRFYGGLAIERQRRGDTPGSKHCAHLVADLARAMVEADDWRCAAGTSGRSASRLGTLRTFNNGVNHLSTLRIR